MIEDSRNGLLAATGAGLPTLITTSTYTVDEDFTEADRVVPELGDAPNINVTLADLGELAARARRGLRREDRMAEISQGTIEQAIKTTAATVLRNEQLFLRPRRPRRRRRLRHLAGDRLPA